MGRLQRINDVVNNSINTYAHVKVFPRGVPYFQDSLLRGTIRFGRRTGNNIAVINPDNTSRFGAAASINDTHVTLQYQSNWIDLNCILSLGPGQELNQVSDVSGTLVTLSKPLGQAYTTDNQVLLWAFPIIMQVGATAGDTTVIVSSHYPLGNGEVFTYLQTDGLLESLYEIRASTATFNGTSADPYYTQIYTLQLDKPLTRSIPSGTQVYHRAYPAYFSQPVPVPLSVNSSEPIGPFLIDLLSGRIVEGTSPRETIGVRTINSSGGFVVGTSTSYVSMPKNSIVLERQISSDFPMFWELAEGTMRLTPNSLVMNVNQDPDRLFFCAGIRCIPSFPAAGNSWRMTLKATDNCSIRFIFDPYPPIQFNLLSGIIHNAVVTVPVGPDPVTRVEVNILGQSTICQVRMSDWTPVGNTVTQVQYSLVVEATGIATYQSTGLVIKPFFLSSDFLQATYDQANTNYDGGKVYF